MIMQRIEEEKKIFLKNSSVYITCKRYEKNHVHHSYDLLVINCI